VFDIIEKVLSYSAILSTIQNHSSNRIEIRNRRRRRRERYSNSKNHRITFFETHSAFIMSREMQSFRIAVASHSITENVLYSNVRINRRSFMFDARSQTNNSQRERSIYINIERDLIFWMKNVLDKLLEMIKMIKEKNRNLIKNYNDQVDVIDEYFTKRNEYLVKKKTLQKENIILQNELIDQKFVLRTMRQKLKIFETAQNRIRNARDLITSSFVSSSMNHIAEMTADINASNRFEKTKRSVVISDSTIFIENKVKFEHWLAIMQRKLKANENWYLIERMTMIYVNIKLNDEAYKHIAIRLNKNFSRRYLTVDEVFDDFKRVYVDSNKMQIVMNAFIKLTQTDKYVEFHTFWNEFQRFMKKMNLSKHFLLIELKRKMFYRLQNVLFIEFNIIDDIYELARQAQLKENHYKRIDDANSVDDRVQSLRSRSRRKLQSVVQ
jgi:hypothetical protein